MVPLGPSAPACGSTIRHASFSRSLRVVICTTSKGSLPEFRLSWACTVRQGTPPSRHLGSTCPQIMLADRSTKEHLYRIPNFGPTAGSDHPRRANRCSMPPATQPDATLNGVAAFHRAQISCCTAVHLFHILYPSFRSLLQPIGWHISLSFPQPCLPKD